MNLPTLKQLTAELISQRDYLRANFKEEDLADEEGENSGSDIRIQYVDGNWRTWEGDNQYDTDHRGAWGYGFIGYNASVKELRDVARNMLVECRDAYNENRLNHDASRE